MGDSEVKVVLRTVLVRVAIAVRPIVVARDWLIIRVPVAAERDANSSRERIACCVLSCYVGYPSAPNWDNGAVHVFPRAIPCVVIRWAVASAGGGVPVETLVAIREVGNVAGHSGDINLLVRVDKVGGAVVILPAIEIVPMIVDEVAAVLLGGTSNRRVAHGKRSDDEQTRN